MFWNDLWGIGMLKWRFPQLFSFANKWKVSVKQQLHENFSLPLPEQAMHQFTELQTLLDTWHFDHETHDVWMYIWGNALFIHLKTSLQAVEWHPPCISSLQMVMEDFSTTKTQILLLAITEGQA